MRKLLKKDTIGDQLIPESSYELIDHLATLYPQRCIHADESIQEAHRYAGAAQLVLNLVEWKRRECEPESS